MTWINRRVAGQGRGGVDGIHLTAATRKAIGAGAADKMRTILK